jgi:hypothetical protein
MVGMGATAYFLRVAENDPIGGVNRIRATMTLPTVNEIVRRPEAVTRDTFIADLSPVPRPSGTPRAA